MNQINLGTVTFRERRKRIRHQLVDLVKIRGLNRFKT